MSTMMHGAALLVALLGAQAAQGRVMQATSCADVVRGYVDTEVDVVMVTRDINCTEASWADVPTPVPVRRNLTFLGIPPGPDGMLLTWDNNFLSHKVRLVNSTLTFKYVVTFGTRRNNQNLAPGYDLLVPCDRGDWGRLVVDSCYTVQRLCLPPSYHNQSLSGAPRPAGVPGVQSFQAILPQPACQSTASDATYTSTSGRSSSNGLEVAIARAPPPPLLPLLSLAPPQLRCWPHLGFYQDFAVACADLDVNQKYIAAGYTIQLVNTRYVCDETISVECVQELGAVGCYSAWDTYKASHGSPTAVNVTLFLPRNASSEPAGDGGSSGGGLSQMGQVLVGAIIGGVAAAGLLVAAGVGFARWHRRRAAGLLPMASKPDGMGPALQCQGPQHGDGNSGDLGIRVGADLHGTALSTATAVDTNGRVDAAAPKWMLCPVTPCWRSPRASRNSSASASPTAAAGARLKLTASSAVGHKNVLSDTGSGAATGTSPDTDPCAFAIGFSSTPGAGAAQQHAAPASRGSNRLEDSHQSHQGKAEAHQGQQQQQADGDGEGEAEASMYDTVEVVTLDRPVRHVELKAESLLDPTVTLLPITLGRGAFGRVVEGRYQGQRVAVKLLNDSAFLVSAGVAQSTGNAAGARGPRAEAAGGATEGHSAAREGSHEAAMRHHLREALAQEVEVMGRCRHPNVLRLLAACVAPPRLCLVMELMETSLERLLYGSGSSYGHIVGGRAGGGGDGGDGVAPQPLLPLAVVLDIALDVAHGLSYLHPTIIHRDLKPGNVLLNMSGPKPVAKLADFGISRIASTVLNTDHPEAGTPAFMAPELFDIDNYMVSHKVDVYSFGILLWSMLSGEVPWQDLTLVQMAYRVAVLQERPPLAAIPTHRLPPKMIRLITSCWDPVPERRPAAAEAVKQLLLIKEEHSGLQAA